MIKGLTFNIRIWDISLEVVPWKYFIHTRTHTHTQHVIWLKNLPKEKKTICFGALKKQCFEKQNKEHWSFDMTNQHLNHHPTFKKLTRTVMQTSLLGSHHWICLIRRPHMGLDVYQFWANWGHWSSLVVKAFACHVEDPGSIPHLGTVSEANLRCLPPVILLEYSESGIKCKLTPA